MKKKKRAKTKKTKKKTTKTTTKTPKRRAIPMEFNVLNFVLGSTIAKNRGLPSAKTT